MAIDKQVNVIISSVDRYSSGLSSFRGSLNMVLGSIIAIEAALIATSIVMAKFTVSMATTAVKSAIDFHDAILNVAAVAQSFGTTTDEIDTILTDLTIKFPLTGKAAGDAMQLIAQMGYGGAEQLQKMSDAALTVQIATGADLQTVISAMIGTMNAFEMSIDQVDRVANLFVITANTSAADIPKLAEAMKRAAAVGNTFGISLEQTTALMAILIQRGTEATTASTIFRQAIASLYKETDKGVVALAKYGLTYKDLQAASTDLTKLIGLFEGQVLKGEDAIAIFGVRQVNLTGIINAGAGAFSKYVKEITGTTAAGDTMEMKMLSWGVVSNQIEGSMDKLKDTIGRDLLKAVIDLIGIDAESGIRGIVGQLIKLEEKYGFIGGPLLQAFEDLKDIAENVFKEAFGDAEGLYQWLSNLSVVLSKNIQIIGLYAAAFTKAFAQSTTDTKNLTALIKIFNVAWGALSLTVAIIHDLFVGFFYVAQLGFANLKMVWELVHISILKGVNNIYKALDLLPTKKFDFTKEIAANDAAIAKLTSNMTTIFDVEPPKLWSGEVVKAMAKSGTAIQNMGFKQVEVTKEAGLTVKKISELGNEWDYVDGKIVKAKGSVEELNLTEEESKRLVKVLKEEYVKVVDEIENKIIPAQDKHKSSIDETAVAQYQIIGGVKTYTSYQDEAFDAVDKTNVKTKELVVSTKEVEKEVSELSKHELTLETAKFKSELKVIEIEAKATGDIAKAALEWEAKLNIAKFESSARKVEAIFGGIATSVQSTAEASASMFEAFAGATGTGSKIYTMEKLLKEQLAIQKIVATSQALLTNAQAELLLAQAQSIRTDGVKIDVNIQGNTAGWLNGLMESLMKEIFIQAEIEGFQCFGV